MTDKKPTIHVMLPPLCEEHEHDDIEWAHHLFSLAAATPYVMEKCGYDAETGTKADPEKLTEVLGEIGCLGCYLGAT